MNSESCDVLPGLAWPPGLKSLSCSKIPGGFFFLNFDPYSNSSFLGISGNGSSPKIVLLVLKLPANNSFQFF